MDNQQLNLLSREQSQVFLSGVLGDGGIYTTNTNSTYYKTNCKFEEYIDYKSKLLGDMFKHKHKQEYNGFCNTPIYIMRSCSSNLLKVIKNMSIEEILNYIDDLGIALWFYDDGSLHKHDLFYNLNTQAFSKEIQENLFIPFFKKKRYIPCIEN